MEKTKGFIQRKAGEFYGFDFGDTKLKYTFRDGTGERTFPVPYIHLDLDNSTNLIVNLPGKTKRYSLTPFIFLIFAVICSIFVKGGSGAAMVILAFLSFIVLLVANIAKIFKAEYTLIPMTPVPAGAHAKYIKVLHNKDADVIRMELLRRWKEAVKMQFGHANLSQHPDQEIARLRRLKDLDVLTQAEVDNEIRKVLAAGQVKESDPSTLN